MQNEELHLANHIFLVFLTGAETKDTCDRCGSCLDLTHGLNPSIEIDATALRDLPTTAISVGAWVSINDTGGAHSMFRTKGATIKSGYSLKIIEGKVRWRIFDDNGDIFVDVTTKLVVVPEALWTHIIATYNTESGKVTIFVNGMLKSNETVVPKNLKMLPQDWGKLARIGGITFNGYLDEFLLYNWQMDQSEALYVRNYCADHPKLVRFTVRVPLTRRNFINKVKSPGSQSLVKNRQTLQM